MYRIFYLFLFFGCAQVTSLNLQKHQFGKIPTKIAWIQIAGLSEEHLALLKYSYPNANINTQFEEALCIGKTWEYTLFDLRPKAREGFLSQLTGKKNIQGSCDDYKQKPIWSYLTKRGYKTGIFETENSSQDSLLAANKCKEENKFLDKTFFWKMTPRIPKNAELFHVGEQTQYKTDQVYYDRSCKSGECFSTLESNIEKTFSAFSKNNKNFIYLVRDFKFNDLINKNKIKDAKLHLGQLDKVIGFFRSYAERNDDFMLLITSSAVKNPSFPRQGREWQAYEKSGRYLQNKKSQLISPLFVYGARAENFCGIYDQSQILARIFSGAKKQGLEFTILNPFDE
jgi:hypothetical protein